MGCWEIRRGDVGIDMSSIDYEVDGRNVKIEK